MRNKPVRTCIVWQIRLWSRFTNLFNAFNTTLGQLIVIINYKSFRTKVVVGYILQRNLLKVSIKLWWSFNSFHTVSCSNYINNFFFSSSVVYFSVSGNYLAKLKENLFGLNKINFHFFVAGITENMRRAQKVYYSIWNFARGLNLRCAYRKHYFI